MFSLNNLNVTKLSRNESVLFYRAKDSAKQNIREEPTTLVIKNHPSSTLTLSFFHNKNEQHFFNNMSFSVFIHVYYHSQR